LVGKLNEETKQESASLLNIGANLPPLERDKYLEDAIKNEGRVKGFFKQRDIEILQRYCEDMSISCEDRELEEVQEQLKEEVMLLGMEGILSMLDNQLMDKFKQELQVEGEKEDGEESSQKEKEAQIKAVVLKVFRLNNPDIKFHFVDEAEQRLLDANEILVKQEPREYPVEVNNVHNHIEIFDSNSNDNADTAEDNDNGRPDISSIKPGTPKKDLEQFYVADLRKYLQQKQLKASGTRSELVSRVLKLLKVEGKDAADLSNPPTPALLENEENVVNNVNNHPIPTTPSTSTSTKKSKRIKRITDLQEEDSEGFSDENPENPKKRTRYNLRSTPRHDH